ncbi:cell division initiation protein [Streptomyces sp. AJS327]|uniref:cell division initiation protein n=1 Tax=Streptomyces sp. AJS327 TaxID=2545265 RepID=UPI0015DD5A60|nr:cell division initiation protein [Streptomyces sp. AJS327]MBA0051789.1 cell division initiation protein [Streptomyces sp. AJS327]
MDVQQKLDEIVAAVGSARSMPMSASCVVNRAELLAQLDEVREALPGSLAQAQQVLGGREQVVAEAQREADRIIESARAERGALVSGTEVARVAREEADRILAEAHQEASQIRSEADDYVDSKLANFEVVLSKTIGSVDRGREKLLGSGPGAEEWNDQYAAEAPERTADPQELRQRADAYVDARLGSVSAVLTKTLEAVGRGRQKLLGHQPSDELADHMAQQDGAAPGLPHTSDADYYAGLATAGAVLSDGQPAAEPAPRQAMAGVAPAADPYQAAPAAEPAYQAQPDPYGYGGQNAYYPQGEAYDPYYAQSAQPLVAAQPPPPPTAQPEQPAQPGYDPGGYGTYDPAPYAPTGYEPQYGSAPYPPQQPPQPPSAQLDETSFFDTSMIDISQVREYEDRERNR